MVFIAGEIVSQGYPHTARPLKKATGGGKAILRGQVLSYDTGAKVWKVASDGDKKPFGIAMKAAAEADTEILDVLMNPPFECTVKASGAIDPYTYVQADDNGEVQAWTGDPNTLSLNSDDYRVGLYIGTEGHLDGHTPAVAAAQNDIIVIRRVE
jgi:hypothetical protein